jgi:threonine dehydratase
MSPLPRPSVSLDDVRAARERIAGRVHRTPVVTSRQLDERLGCRLFFKCEMFQRAGAFKTRGAFSRLTQLSPAERARGVVAFSSGNHAQAVALAARDLGMEAAIVMPTDAPALKLAATRGYGARVVPYDRVSGNREEIARRLVAERGAILVPPFDDDAVIAGQGTLALELLEDVPDLELLVAPCGGGGLLSGIAVAGRGVKPGLRLFGVEPEAGDDMKRSLAAGEPVSIPVPATIADALQTTRPAERTLAIVAALVEAILTVSDRELVNAMALLAERLKLVVEPGGAAAFAALLHGKVPAAAGRRVGVVLSGGNVDPARFGSLLADAAAESSP